jgi:hypothetical protein
MWWHHYAGLVFVLFSFTWALSGALSLTPWDWTPFTDPTEAQQRSVSGGPLRLEELEVARLQTAHETLARSSSIKELDILQFQARPLVMAYEPPTLGDALRVNTPDLGAIHSAQLALPHRMVWADAPATSFDRLAEEAMSNVAQRAMPGVPVTGQTWLTEYDAYYYDRYRAKPLPVLRVQYADTDRTWLYLDPQNGLVSLRHTMRSRLNRWLYNGLHSWDLPFLYFRRPAWDIALIVLSLGGIALSVTSMWPAWRRLRRLIKQAL